MDHFIKRRCDQSRQANDIDILFTGGLEDGFSRDHDTQVNDLVTVTLQHYADDVLADVMHVTLHGRHQDAAITPRTVTLFCIHVRQQIGHGLFHDTRRFHHLGQEHLAGPEQITDDVHTVHQRPLDYLQGFLGCLPCGLGVFLDEIGNTLDQCMFKTLVDVPFPPLQVVGLFRSLAVTAVVICNLQQALGGVITAVQDNIFYALTQFLRDVLVDRQLPGIHNTHVHAVFDGVIQEHRVDGLAYRVIAAKRERHVGNTTGYQGMRKSGLDVVRGLNEIVTVVIVFLDTGRNRKDIRIEDNILRRKTDLPGQDFVGTCTNLDFTLSGIGLSFLVKGHDNGCGTVTPHQPGVVDEFFLAFLETDGVHHPLALDAFQACLDDVPFRGVNHDGHTGDIRFGRDQIQEAHHGIL